MHLGKLLNAEQVINRGWPARSNGSIYRIGMQDISNCYKQFGNNGVVIIQWSGAMRLEIINPYIFNLDLIYNGSGTHPGQESGPYLSFASAEIASKSVQSRFKGLYEYFFNHWAYQPYQQELLINYSLSLTALAEKLGITIIQFNGIDEIIPSILPEHVLPALELLGKEFYYPTDRSKTFWKVPRKLQEGSMMPIHPTAEQHEAWATTLYNYMLDTHSDKLE
jgi:hypothetical protein